MLGLQSLNKVIQSGKGVRVVEEGKQHVALPHFDDGGAICSRWRRPKNAEDSHRFFTLRVLARFGTLRSDSGDFGFMMVWSLPM